MDVKQASGARPVAIRAALCDIWRSRVQRVSFCVPVRFDECEFIPCHRPCSIEAADRRGPFLSADEFAAEGDQDGAVTWRRISMPSCGSRTSYRQDRCTDGRRREQGFRCLR